jgi:hypothetical protein
MACDSAEEAPMFGCGTAAGYRIGFDSLQSLPNPKKKTPKGVIFFGADDGTPQAAIEWVRFPSIIFIP